MKRLLLISISALFLDGCVYPSPYGYSRYTTITPVYPRTYYEHRYYTSPPRYHYYQRNDRRPYFQQRHHW